MTFRLSSPVIIAALFAASAVQATEVRIEGAAESAGTRELPANARLDDALLLARPSADAYLLGTSFERPQAMEDQVRLRAGLQYGAGQLAEASDTQLSALARTLQAWLDAHPATGRMPIASSARLIQVQPANNPVLANGDITDARKARAVLQATGVDGLMIGRAAQGRPWIFREISHFLATGQELPPLSPAEAGAILHEHLLQLYAFYGEEAGVRIARKHLGWYAKDRPENAGFRAVVNRAETAEAQLRCADHYFQTLAAGDPATLQTA